MSLSIDSTNLHNSPSISGTQLNNQVSLAPLPSKTSISELVAKELSSLQSAERQLESAIGGVGKGQNASLKDLLSIQNQASRFHLKVEVASRVAEAASSSIRRLQQG
jgi:hypothetical protein